MTISSLHPDSWPPSHRGALAEQRCRGKRQGPALCHYDNGQPAWRGAFVDDRPVGPWVFFDEQGRLVASRDFDRPSHHRNQPEATCAAL